MPKLVSDYYILIENIGHGSFGKVYIAQHTSGGFVAVKTEETYCDKRRTRIENEYNIYTHLRKSGMDKGLPKIYDFMKTPEYNFLFMELLGPSLDDIFDQYKKIFEPKLVSIIAGQLITLLEKVHDGGYVHRDIKPSNFLLGRDTDFTKSISNIHIMDFGLSKCYLKNGKHIEYRDNRSLVGTPRYASKNMHRGIEPSRRDDLEAVGYMLLYFLKGKLPWQGMKRRKNVIDVDAIGEKKLAIPLDELCVNVPDNCKMKQYMEHCMNLKFDERPKYEYLRSLFT
jgi:serine/threonine protein kinase